MQLQKALGRALISLVVVLPMAASGAGTDQGGGFWAGKTKLPWLANEVDARKMKRTLDQSPLVSATRF